MAQITTNQPGRKIGVIARINGTRGRGFGFIKDAENNEYFLHKTSCVPNSLFDQVQEGEPVSFKVTDTPKGQKAFDMERATVEEAGTIAVGEETRGNV